MTKLREQQKEFQIANNLKNTKKKRHELKKAHLKAIEERDDLEAFENQQKYVRRKSSSKNKGKTKRSKFEKDMSLERGPFNKSEYVGTGDDGDFIVDDDEDSVLEYTDDEVELLDSLSSRSTSKENRATSSSRDSTSYRLKETKEPYTKDEALRETERAELDFMGYIRESKEREEKEKKKQRKAEKKERKRRAEADSRNTAVLEALINSNAAITALLQQHHQNK